MSRKMNFQSVLALVLLIGISQSSAAEDDPSAILAQAINLASKTSYTAEMRNHSSRPQSIWMKKYSGGKVCSRVESILPDGRKIVMLQNEKGKFTMIGRKVIRNAPLPEIEKKVHSAASENQYALTEGMHGTIPCYIVSEKIKSSGFKKEYYIGKKDLFIYQWNLYNDKGRQFASLEYSNVTLNPPMDNSLFELPENAEVTVTGSRGEETDAMIKLLGPQSPAEKKES